MNDMSQTHGAWTPDGETPPKITETAVIDAISTVFDPEIPVNIYELGLIYTIEIADDGAVKVEMTLTTPSCPSAQELPGMVEDAMAGRIQLAPFVTHTMPLTGINDAFDLMHEGKSIRSVVHY